MPDVSNKQAATTWHKAMCNMAKFGTILTQWLAIDGFKYKSERKENDKI